MWVGLYSESGPLPWPRQFYKEHLTWQIKERLDADIVSFIGVFWEARGGKPILFQEVHVRHPDLWPGDALYTDWMITVKG